MAARHWIQSLQWIPLPFFTDNPTMVILGHIHQPFQDIHPQNWQQQCHHNLLHQPFAYDSHCHRGKRLATIHFIWHQHAWRISIPNPYPYNEPYFLNLVRQKLGSWQSENWILVVRDSVILRSVISTGSVQPDGLIKTLGFKFVVDSIPNSVQY